MASLLNNYGIRVAIVDKLAEPVVLTKAAALWSRSLEMLHHLSLDETFLAAGHLCYGANIFVGSERVAHLGLEQIESHYNYILMLPQHHTERLFREHLSRHGVEIKRAWELVDLHLSDGGVTLTSAEGLKITADYVVGCDGAHSQVRKLVDQSFAGSQNPHKWLVADVSMWGLSLPDEVLAYLHDDGPLAVFPLGDKHYRIVAETRFGPDSCSNEEAEREARELLHARIPDKIEILSFRDVGFFRIHERQVDQYGQGRVFLAGDAAHVHSPLGGQGMNTGLQDAFNLAWKIAMVGNDVLKEELLASYSAERHPVAAAVLKTTGFGTDMLTLRSSIARHLRDKVLSLAANLAPLQNRARSTLSELNIHYAPSALSKEPATPVSAWLFGKGVPAGHRAPDGPVKRDSADEFRLHSLFTGCRFHLLLFASFNDQGQWPDFGSVAELARSRGDWIQRIWVGTSLERPPLQEEEISVLDITQLVHNAYSATSPCWYLVRPDGYVGCRGLAGDLKTLKSYLETITH